MGDFFLNLGATSRHVLDTAGEFLKFFPDIRVERFEYPEFGMIVSSADDPHLWGPHTALDGSVVVVLCGRIALDQDQWNKAMGIEGDGGLASKFIYQSYMEQGITGVEELSGNFVILVFDRPARKLLIVTDRWGLVPAFKLDDGSGVLAYSSHPDVLADATGERRNWDLTSFAEFILSGRLSAPFTYYKKIKSLPVASTTILSFPENGRSVEKIQNYFHFVSQPQCEEKLEELVEQFAEAFKRAVSRRTLPLLGRSAVALSGGLDSRTILCAAHNRQDLVSFSCYDEENREFQIARTIARQTGVEFFPLQRNFDYYGNSSALGVRISGGMGCIASNHFLGFREQLRTIGIKNLLTGCYCDYLFKGLALNKRTNRWTTREHLGPFEFSYYSSHFHADTAPALAVQERHNDLFPTEIRQHDNERAVMDVERRRIFPLSYEEDNAERIIPQRVMGWYVPVADNGLMDLMLKMSCSMKLNRKLFVKMVAKVCDAQISAIPDANTGAPVNASLFQQAFNSHLSRAQAFYRKLRPSNATNGSWLNWNYYARESRIIQSLWASPNSDAAEVFRLVLGKDGFHSDISAYQGKQIYLFLQLFTLKLWFDQRAL